MSTAKHELRAQLERIAAIEAIAIEVKAIGYDDDNDETSSNDDPDAEMQLYARAFQAWADGKITGTDGTRAAQRASVWCVKNDLSTGQIGSPLLMTQPTASLVISG